MAGHSHWAQIKRKKGAEDAKRGALFGRLSKEITVAAKMGGGDSNFNPRLRTAIAAAKAQSMPQDRIENAVNKGLGKIEGIEIEEFVYEGYGPSGTAFLVEAATDNKNRAVAEVRAAFSKNGGNLAGSGSVAWMFKKTGLFLVESDSEDAVLEAALDAGAEDVQQTDVGVEVTCPPEQFDAVEKALQAASLSIRESKLSYIPTTLNPVASEEEARKVFQLLEKLEDVDDVQRVHANFDISPEILKKIQDA